MGYQKCANALNSDRFPGLTQAYFEANPDDFPPKLKISATLSKCL